MQARGSDLFLARYRYDLTSPTGKGLCGWIFFKTIATFDKSIFASCYCCCISRKPGLLIIENLENSIAMSQKVINNNGSMIVPCRMQGAYLMFPIVFDVDMIDILGSAISNSTWALGRNLKFNSLGHRSFRSFKWQNIHVLNFLWCCWRRLAYGCKWTLILAMNRIQVQLVWLNKFGSL